MLLMCIMNKPKNTKILRYLMGQDIELVTRDIELMEEEEKGPPKNYIQKPQHIIETKQRCERLIHMSPKQILTLVAFDK
jgi:hypothetical protein